MSYPPSLTSAAPEDVIQLKECLCHALPLPVPQRHRPPNLPATWAFADLLAHNRRMTMPTQQQLNEEAAARREFDRRFFPASAPEEFSASQNGERQPHHGSDDDDGEEAIRIRGQRIGVDNPYLKGAFARY